MSAKDFFEDIETGDGDQGSSYPVGSHRHGRNEALFDEIKTRMVMRINGITAEEARKLIASMAEAAMATGDQQSSANL